MSVNPLIGQIQAFGFNFPPRSWAFCQGQILAIAQNSTLFSLLGTTFGGDGRTTFALPDLRSRSMVGVGTGPGLDTITWGERGGAITHTLSTAQMPSHTHNTTVAVNTSPGEEVNPAGIISSHSAAFNEDPTTGAELGGVSAGNTGSSQAYNIRNPFLGIYYSIAMTGTYPSRN